MRDADREKEVEERSHIAGMLTVDTFIIQALLWRDDWKVRVSPITALQIQKYTHHTFSSCCLHYKLPRLRDRSHFLWHLDSNSFPERGQNVRLTGHRWNWILLREWAAGAQMCVCVYAMSGAIFVRVAEQRINAGKLVASNRWQNTFILHRHRRLVHFLLSAAEVFVLIWPKVPSCVLGN